MCIRDSRDMAGNRLVRPVPAVLEIRPLIPRRNGSRTVGDVLAHYRRCLPVQFRRTLRMMRRIDALLVGRAEAAFGKRIRHRARPGAGLRIARPWRRSLPDRFPGRHGLGERIARRGWIAQHLSLIHI